MKNQNLFNALARIFDNPPLESDMFEIIEAVKKDFGSTVPAIPYQLCPKCNGQGQVSKPPHIAGDVHEWSSSSTVFPCDVCNGSKIIRWHG